MIKILDKQDPAIYKEYSDGDNTYRYYFYDNELEINGNKFSFNKFADFMFCESLPMLKDDDDKHPMDRWRMWYPIFLDHEFEDTPEDLERFTRELMRLAYKDFGEFVEEYSCFMPDEDIL